MAHENSRSVGALRPTREPSESLTESLACPSSLCPVAAHKFAAITLRHVCATQASPPGPAISPGNAGMPRAARPAPAGQARYAPASTSPEGAAAPAASGAKSIDEVNAKLGEVRSVMTDNMSE